MKKKQKKNKKRNTKINISKKKKFKKVVQLFFFSLYFFSQFITIENKIMLSNNLLNQKHLYIFSRSQIKYSEKKKTVELLKTDFTAIKRHQKSVAITSKKKQKNVVFFFSLN